MTTASNRDGTDTDGEIVTLGIGLTPVQGAAVPEAADLVEWVGTALGALALLRTGQDAAGRPYSAGPADWHLAIRTIEYRLLPRLGGIRDAAVRAHAAAGGTVADLAAAMGVARATAQHRRKAVLDRGVSDAAEHWAVTGSPWDAAWTHTADVVVIREGAIRSVLLIERGTDPYAGHDALPGGRVDKGESALEAAARELAEETGITVALANLHRVGVYDRVGRDPRGLYSSTAYAVTVPAGTQAEAAADAAAVRWVPVDELLADLADGSADLAFDHSAILAAALRLTGDLRTPVR
ncbi:NUDIX domain-containing protein [Kitasatospora sp. NPDC004272]